MAKRTPSNPWTKPAGAPVQGKVIPRPRRTAEVQSYLPEFFRGIIASTGPAD